jgi:hypothetical protein
VKVRGRLKRRRKPSLYKRPDLMLIMTDMPDINSRAKALIDQAASHNDVA